jgi:leader peptidase (prepilin peptidase)/N-methyltransferase
MVLAMGAGLAGVSPYLAGLTLTVPDDQLGRWWVGVRAAGRRTAATGGFALLFGGLAAISAAWSATFWATLPALVFLAAVAAPLAVIDFEHHRLPDRLVGCAAVGGVALLGVAALLVRDGGPLLRAVEAGAVVFGLLAVLTLLGPFGFGDTKLAAVLALYLGWYGWAFVLYGILAGFVLASLLSLPLVMVRRLSMRSLIPLGPSLLVGALLVLAFRLVPNSLG